ncbi:putative E3 ubiquitin-protein ligase UBR7 isoform X2 [Amphibalanus amphitrite]|nr:putative E3 ubiquitin-protein ligase UBR7 isoform X2 [Amphibalanus amphitrite]XP_043192754.1 putative E3 ubiquitin-protein ligase UBR7 isoform X2 [Amphibalanus amphitrite]
MSDGTAEAGSSGSAIPPNEDSVTMLDVLQEEEELDEDAAAVLGNTDDKHCSYDQGYMKRQPLYSCLTCSDKDRPAGVCLACSYHCHEAHELVELYTKRNFRCDCGGCRMPDVTCRLTAKTGDNEANSYNQNYAGLYCTCSRPYPDPEDATPDQMVQCVVCEDWFHGRHMGVRPPADSDYAEMTCAGCVERLPFLGRYAADTEMAANTSNKSPKKVSSASPKNSPKKESSCRLPSGKLPSPSKAKGALFWKQGWRKLLCTCDDCKAMYQSSSVEFLLDEEDSVAAYEARGRRDAGSYAAGMRALENMDRVQQIEVVHEYNDLKSELMSYLKKFAENKKVVREEDIQEFFSGMKSRKRQKTEMSHYCR